jgi:alkylation response protein AidB-like acyl-CoA dehydrogenase
MPAILERPTAHTAEDLLQKINQIASALGQDIAGEAKNRRLSEQTIQLLRQNKLHQLFLPQSLGGLELDPPSVAKLVEAVSMHNTAAGWSMMVANVSTWWCWRLNEKGVETIFSNGGETFIAGAFHPPMACTREKGGLRINGRSPLCSNVHDSIWTFVTAMVMDNGKPIFHGDIPEMVGVMMKTSEVNIIDTWDTIGMKSTDSCDVEAKNIFVPEELSFPLAPVWNANNYFDGALYKFPALGASIASLIAPVALAVARNAIEEVKSLATKKTSFGSVSNLAGRGAVQSKIGKAEGLVRAARVYLFDELKKAWNKILSGQTLSLEEKADLSLAATHCNQSCFQAVDLMYSVAGTTGIYMRSKLSQLFTDAQVIRQHGFANESRYETAAQVFLGLPPDLPVLGF